MVSYISEIKDTLKDIMTTDRSTVLMGMNISSGGAWGESDGLSQAVSSKRLIDMPYSVSSVVSAALGLSQSGARPIVTIKGEYLLKTVDTLANKVAVNDYITNGSIPSNMLIISEIGMLPNKGVQAVSVYESVLSQIKGLKVYVIARVKDVRKILYGAYKYSGPVLVLLCSESMRDEGIRSEAEYEGKAQVVREGSDVTVITYGAALKKVLSAAENASSKGVEAEVIDLVCISDIDMHTIEQSVEKTAKVIIVHNAGKNLGVGAEVAAKIAESEVFFYLEDRIIRLCGKDGHIPYSKEDCEKFVPSEEEILDAMLTIGR